MRTPTLLLRSALLGAALAAPAGALDLDAWDALLAAHTSEVADTAGVRVDYARIADDPRWPALLASLADADEPTDRDARLAFWTNAYNILTIDVVIRNRPLESIRDAGSFLRPVWNRPAGRAAGAERTLGEIEHEILRPLGDPRIHAAIVCASVSCPSLRREAFRAERLDAQFDDAARRFLADERKGARISEGGNALRVSRIFKWFDEDFEDAGGVLAWLTPRLPESTREWLDGRADRPRLLYFDYDWALNDTAG